MLRHTLQAMFERMGHARSNAIVIDKSAIELSTFTTMINDDPWHWMNNILGGE